VLDKYEEAGDGDARARVAAVFLLTVRGTPCLYYGEEIGLKPAISAYSAVGTDVDGRDPSRTPMQWDPSGGFTTGRPWLPYGAELERRNVAVQAGDPGSLLTLYRRLIRLRRDSVALRRGAYRTLEAPDGVYAYRREHDAEHVLVALNFTGAEREVRTDGGAWRCELSTHPGPVAARDGVLVLRPDEAVVLRRAGGPE
jgi:glycosidase